MKKLALVVAITATSDQLIAATYDLDWAGLDCPNPPYGSHACLDDHYTLDNFSISPVMDLTSPIATFSITLNESLVYGFSYSADWTYYSSSGYILANNVSCISLNETNFCGSGVFGGLINDGGFTAVQHSSSPEGGFSLSWDEYDNSNGYPYAWNWKLDFAPTTAVPIPAAVWMFGAALIGLVGFKRKR